MMVACDTRDAKKPSNGGTPQSSGARKDATLVKDASPIPCWENRRTTCAKCSLQPTTPFRKTKTSMKWPTSVSTRRCTLTLPLIFTKRAWLETGDKDTETRNY